MIIFFLSSLNHPVSIEGMTNKNKIISNFFNQKQETKKITVDNKETKKEINGIHNFFEKILIDKKMKTSKNFIIKY